MPSSDHASTVGAVAGASPKVVGELFAIAVVSGDQKVAGGQDAKSHRGSPWSAMLLRPRPSSIAVDEGEAGADLEGVLTPAGVLVEGELTGVPAGTHGLHVHTVGKCDGPSFMSAGGHFNPAGTPHGSHAGDFPPLFATADGSAFEVFTTDRFKLQDLFDLVIDDQKEKQGLYMPGSRLKIESAAALMNKAGDCFLSVAL